MLSLGMINPVLAQRDWLSDSLLVVGLALITTWLLMRLRKKRKAPPASTPTHSERVEFFKQQRGMRGDLESLMVEIEQLARRFGAQLDAKSIHLEKLIQEADQRIATLKQVSSASDTHTSTDRWPADSSGTAPTQPQLSTDPSAHAPMPDSIPTTRHSIEATDPKPDPMDDPLAQRVYDLSQQGMDPVQIAQELQEHVGKIELILALKDT